MSPKFSSISVSVKKRPALAAAVVMIFFILALMFYRYDQIGIYESELVTLQDNLTKIQRNVANSAQLDRQLGAIKKINRAIEVSALRPADLAKNSQYFYTLEASNNVKLLELQQQPIAQAPKGTVLPLHVPITFNISLTGDYPEILKFMREIGKTFLGGKILSATISPEVTMAEGEATETRLLSMTVQAIATTQ